ncbi:unnamed protein product [Acanthoscelides obtectus]|uniref:Leucine-rich repeat-containing protein 59 n=1 Tax=Acanthoscelides obtectus TaxID=200917 RepID=A0A9P0LLH8_ACAOB|nr:unnamed protein product [Acanthoscelides obtectus]CAK1659482.1 Leucine-rich repeat-containing protein 59 [Acanthoscelides obtectus]
MPSKINVKERLTDGEIDLSMSDLEDVPVKDIVQFKKATSLDLSNNRLTFLPANFSLLTHITKLDLSKNELQSLPDDFGNLVKLRRLDLYHNQLKNLPLSFSKLKELKWLDLKDNSLEPAIAKVAGPCLNSKQCEDCARDVVNFFVKLEKQVNVELEIRNKSKQKQQEVIQQKKKEEKKKQKKEKQKQRQDSNSPSLKNEVNNRAKSKKEKKALKNAQINKSFLSFLFQLFMLFFITMLVLFVSTSVKHKFTENLDILVREWYKRCSDSLPPNYKVYALKFGNYVEDIHTKTGKITLFTVQYVHEKLSQIPYQDILNNLKNIWETLLKAVSEIPYQEILNNLKNLWETFLKTVHDAYESVMHGK